MKCAKFYIIFLIWLILIAIIIRIISLPIIGFHGDFGVFNYWAANLKQFGFYNFYQNTSINYLPIYVYLLKFSIITQPIIQHLNSSWTPDQVVWISYKIPCFIFDLATAYVIFLYIIKSSRLRACLKANNIILGLLGVVLYLYNPVIYHNTYIYGQNNVLLYLPIVLLFYTISTKKFIWAGISMAILLAIKPTGIIILPLALLLMILDNKKNYKAYLQFAISFYITLQLLILPFYFRLPWQYTSIFWKSLTTDNGYKVTQMYSYNFWYLAAHGVTISDATKFLGRSYYFWGELMFGVSYFFALILLYINKAKLNLILASAIFFSFFVFPTRVHESYLLFAFPVLILATLIYKNYILDAIYIITTLVYSYNIWGYWPWKLSSYLPLHYGGRLSIPSAIILSLTPIILLVYYEILNYYSNLQRKRKY